MDNAETSLWDELGVSADEVTPPMPEHLWESAIAAAIDPDTPAVDTNIVPFSDDAATGDFLAAGDDLGAFDVQAGHHDIGQVDAPAGVDDIDGDWGDANPDDIDLGGDGF